jgi:hypothetical protein
MRTCSGNSLRTFTPELESFAFFLSFFFPCFFHFFLFHFFFFNSHLHLKPHTSSLPLLAPPQRRRFENPDSAQASFRVGILGILADDWILVIIRDSANRVRNYAAPRQDLLSSLRNFDRRAAVNDSIIYRYRFITFSFQPIPEVQSGPLLIFQSSYQSLNLCPSFRKRVKNADTVDTD